MTAVIWGTIAVALITAVGGIVVALIKRSTDSESNAFQALQARLDDQSNEIGDLRTRVHTLEDRHIADVEYIQKLRDHIYRELPPPPPPRPE